MKTIQIIFCLILLLINFSMGEEGKDDFSKYESIIKRNPFFTKPSTPEVPAGPSNQGNYRFTGYLDWGNKIQVGIENIVLNQSYCLSPGQKVDEGATTVEVKEVNIKGPQKTVVIEVGGELLPPLSLSDIAPTQTIMESHPGVNPPGTPIGTAPRPPVPVRPRRTLITPRTAGVPTPVLPQAPPTR